MTYDWHQHKGDEAQHLMHEWLELNDPEELENLVHGWQTLRRLIADAQWVHDGDVRVLRDTWRGPAADAFSERMDQLRQKADQFVAATPEIERRLQATADAIRHAKEKMPPVSYRHWWHPGDADEYIGDWGDGHPWDKQADVLVELCQEVERQAQGLAGFGRDDRGVQDPWQPDPTGVPAPGVPDPPPSEPPPPPSEPPPSPSGVPQPPPPPAGGWPGAGSAGAGSGAGLGHGSPGLGVAGAGIVGAGAVGAAALAGKSGGRAAGAAGGAGRALGATVPGMSRPGSMAAGVARPSGGAPNAPVMGSAPGGSDDKKRRRTSSWLREDTDVWGTQNASSGVLDGSIDDA